MNTETFLCRAADVPDGGALKIERAGRPPLAVFNVGGRFFVTDDTCTHGEASLSEGEIDADECVVECPWHSGAFDLATGKPCGAPCTIALKIHAFECRDGALYLLG
ncbi:non-heme iron oxygenase ferredoxin subunit [Zavarzinia aquatilis]|nr:non-heme iron oxygenase ferredoxin subunit [Zavarzinia aquatilis]